MHSQIMIQVNAAVDVGISPLVQSLNKINGLMTVDSCQGTADSWAYVYFTCQGDSAQLLMLVKNLAESLSAQLVICTDDYRVCVEWMAGGERPLAKLLVQPDYITTLADAVNTIAATTACEGCALIAVRLETCERDTAALQRQIDALRDRLAAHEGMAAHPSRWKSQPTFAERLMVADSNGVRPYTPPQDER